MVVRDARAGPRPTNFVTQNYPNKNFVPGTTPSNLLNNTTMTYTPDLTQPLRDLARAAAETSRSRRCGCPGRSRRRTRSARYYNNKKRTVPERRHRRPRTKR